MKKLNRLPEAELTVMRAVWRLEPPVPTGAIRARLEKERPWNLSALQTLLARLTERGFLSVGREGRQNVYTPLVDEGETEYCHRHPVLHTHNGGSQIHNGQLSVDYLLDGNGIVLLSRRIDLRITVVYAVDGLCQKNTVCIHLNRPKGNARIS